MLPVFFVGDLDPYGMEIYLNYVYGSKSSPVENLKITLPSAIYLGIFCEWIVTFASQAFSIPMDKGDWQRLESMKEHEAFSLLSDSSRSKEIDHSLKKLTKNIEFMQAVGAKYEIEQFFDVVEKSRFLLEVLVQDYGIVVD